MKLSRRTFLASLSTLPIAGLASGYYMRFREPNWYEITEKTISIGKFASPLRVLHLSDFHASPDVSLEDIESAIDQSLNLNADIALLTGDFITSQLPNRKAYSRILKKLSNTMPVFACIGNHDGGRWAASYHGYKDFSQVAELLKASGVTLLFNQEQRITLNNKAIKIVGLGDLWSDDCKPQSVLNKQRKQDDVIFVLSHNPDCKSDLKNYDWDIMFCGHTHGGQLVIPLLGLRPFLPVRDRSFPEGIRSWGNQHIHITRGIGNLHGMRFNCRPEISVLNVL